MSRKPLKIAAWTAGSLAGLVIVLIVAVLVGGNTDAGRTMIERITLQLTGGMVKLSGLGGSFPAQLTDRKSTRLNSSHSDRSRMPSSA